MSSTSYDGRAGAGSDQKQSINTTLVALAEQYLGSLSRTKCAYLEAKECVTTKALLAAGVRPQDCFIANHDAGTVHQIKQQYTKLHVYHRSWNNLLEHKQQQYGLVFADYCGTTFGTQGSKNSFDDIDLLYGLQRMAQFSVVAFTFSTRGGGDNSIDNFRAEHGRIALHHGYNATEVHNLSYGSMRMIVFAVAFTGRPVYLTEPVLHKKQERLVGLDEFVHEVLDDHTHMLQPDLKVNVLPCTTSLTGQRIQHNFHHKFECNGKKKTIILWCKGIVVKVNGKVLLVQYHNGDTCRVVLDTKDYGVEKQWFLYS